MASTSTVKVSRKSCSKSIGDPQTDGKIPSNVNLFDKWGTKSDISSDMSISPGNMYNNHCNIKERRPAENILTSIKSSSKNFKSKRRRKEARRKKVEQIVDEMIIKNGGQISKSTKSITENSVGKLRTKQSCPPLGFTNEDKVKTRMGCILHAGLGRPIHPAVYGNLRMQCQSDVKVDVGLAKIAASAVITPNQHPTISRFVVPIVYKQLYHLALKHFSTRCSSVCRESKRNFSQNDAEHSLITRNCSKTQNHLIAMPRYSANREFISGSKSFSDEASCCVDVGVSFLSDISIIRYPSRISSTLDLKLSDSRDELPGSHFRDVNDENSAQNSSDTSNTPDLSLVKIEPDVCDVESPEWHLQDRFLSNIDPPKSNISRVSNCQDPEDHILNKSYHTSKIMRAIRQRQKNHINLCNKRTHQSAIMKEIRQKRKSISLLNNENLVKESSSIKNFHLAEMHSKIEVNPPNVKQSRSDRMKSYWEKRKHFAHQKQSHSDLMKKIWQKHKNSAQLNNENSAWEADSVRDGLPTTHDVCVSSIIDCTEQVSELLKKPHSIVKRYWRKRGSLVQSPSKKSMKASDQKLRIEPVQPMASDNSSNPVNSQHLSCSSSTFLRGFGAKSPTNFVSSSDNEPHNQSKILPSELVLGLDEFLDVKIKVDDSVAEHVEFCDVDESIKNDSISMYQAENDPLVVEEGSQLKKGKTRAQVIKSNERTIVNAENHSSENFPHSFKGTLEALQTGGTNNCELTLLTQPNKTKKYSYIRPKTINTCIIPNNELHSGEVHQSPSLAISNDLNLSDKTHLNDEEALKEEPQFDETEPMSLHEGHQTTYKGNDHFLSEAPSVKAQVSKHTSILASLKPGKLQTEQKDLGIISPQSSYCSSRINSQRLRNNFKSVTLLNQGVSETKDKNQSALKTSRTTASSTKKFVESENSGLLQKLSHLPDAKSDVNESELHPRSNGRGRYNSEFRKRCSENAKRMWLKRKQNLQKKKDYKAKQSEECFYNCSQPSSGNLSGCDSFADFRGNFNGTKSFATGFVSEIEETEVVSGIVKEIVDYACNKEIFDDLVINFDEDYHPIPDNMTAVSSINPSNSKKDRCARELARLNVNIINLQNRTEEEPQVMTNVSGSCLKKSCRLGCICNSVSGKIMIDSGHCSEEKCIFGCVCNFDLKSSKCSTETPSILTPVMKKLHQKSKRSFAAKEFRETVFVCSPDDIGSSIFLSNNRRRDRKLPEKFKDHLVHVSPNFLLSEATSNASEIEVSFSEKVYKKSFPCETRSINSTSFPPKRDKTKPVSPTNILSESTSCASQVEVPSSEKVYMRSFPHKPLVNNSTLFSSKQGKTLRVVIEKLINVPNKVYCLFHGRFNCECLKQSQKEMSNVKDPTASTSHTYCCPSDLKISGSEKLDVGNRPKKLRFSKVKELTSACGCARTSNSGTKYSIRNSRIAYLYHLLNREHQLSFSPYFHVCKWLAPNFGEFQIQDFKLQKMKHLIKLSDKSTNAHSPSLRKLLKFSLKPSTDAAIADYCSLSLQTGGMEPSNVTSKDVCKPKMQQKTFEKCVDIETSQFVLSKVDDESPAIISNVFSIAPEEFDKLKKDEENSCTAPNENFNQLIDSVPSERAELVHEISDPGKTLCKPPLEKFSLLKQYLNRSPLSPPKDRLSSSAVLPQNVESCNLIKDLHSPSNDLLTNKQHEQPLPLFSEEHQWLVLDLTQSFEFLNVSFQKSGECLLQKFLKKNLLQKVVNKAQQRCRTIRYFFTKEEDTPCSEKAGFSFFAVHGLLDVIFFGPFFRDNSLSIIPLRWNQNRSKLLPIPLKEITPVGHKSVFCHSDFRKNYRETSQSLKLSMEKHQCDFICYYFWGPLLSLSKLNDVATSPHHKLIGNEPCSSSLKSVPSLAAISFDHCYSKTQLKHKITTEDVEDDYELFDNESSPKKKQAPVLACNKKQNLIKAKSSSKTVSQTDDLTSLKKKTKVNKKSGTDQVLACNKKQNLIKAKSSSKTVSQTDDLTSLKKKTKVNKKSGTDQDAPEPPPPGFTLKYLVCSVMDVGYLEVLASISSTKLTVNLANMELIFDDVLQASQWLNDYLSKFIIFSPADCTVKWRLVERKNLSKLLEPFNTHKISKYKFLTKEGLWRKAAVTQNSEFFEESDTDTAGSPHEQDEVSNSSTCFGEEAVGRAIAGQSITIDKKLKSSISSNGFARLGDQSEILSSSPTVEAEIDESDSEQTFDVVDFADDSESVLSDLQSDCGKSDWVCESDFKERTKKLGGTTKFNLNSSTGERKSDSFVSSGTRKQNIYIVPKLVKWTEPSSTAHHIEKEQSALNESNLASNHRRGTKPDPSQSSGNESTTKDGSLNTFPMKKSNPHLARNLGSVNEKINSECKRSSDVNSNASTCLGIQSICGNVPKSLGVIELSAATHLVEKQNSTLSSNNLPSNHESATKPLSQSPGNGSQSIDGSLLTTPTMKKSNPNLAGSHRQMDKKINSECKRLNDIESNASISSDVKDRSTSNVPKSVEVIGLSFDSTYFGSYSECKRSRAVNSNALACTLTGNQSMSGSVPKKVEVIESSAGAHLVKKQKSTVSGNNLASNHRRSTRPDLSLSPGNESITKDGSFQTTSTMKQSNPHLSRNLGSVNEKINSECKRSSDVNSNVSTSSITQNQSIGKVPLSAEVIEPSTIAHHVEMNKSTLDKNNLASKHRNDIKSNTSQSPGYKSQSIDELLQTTPAMEMSNPHLSRNLGSVNEKINSECKRSSDVNSNASTSSLTQNQSIGKVPLSAEVIEPSTIAHHVEMNKATLDKNNSACKHRNDTKSGTSQSPGYKSQSTDELLHTTPAMKKSNPNLARNNGQMDEKMNSESECFNNTESSGSISSDIDDRSTNNVHKSVEVVGLSFGSTYFGSKDLILDQGFNQIECALSSSSYDTCNAKYTATEDFTKNPLISRALPANKKIIRVQLKENIAENTNRSKTQIANKFRLIIEKGNHSINVVKSQAVMTNINSARSVGSNSKPNFLTSPLMVKLKMISSLAKIDPKFSSQKLVDPASNSVTDGKPIAIESLGNKNQRSNEALLTVETNNFIKEHDTAKKKSSVITEKLFDGKQLKASSEIENHVVSDIPICQSESEVCPASSRVPIRAPSSISSSNYQIPVHNTVKKVVFHGSGKTSVFPGDTKTPTSILVSKDKEENSQKYPLPGSLNHQSLVSRGPALSIPKEKHQSEKLIGSMQAQTVYRNGKVCGTWAPRRVLVPKIKRLDLTQLPTTIEGIKVKSSQQGAVMKGNGGASNNPRRKRQMRRKSLAFWEYLKRLKGTNFQDAKKNEGPFSSLGEMMVHVRNQTKLKEIVDRCSRMATPIKERKTRNKISRRRRKKLSITISGTASSILEALSKTKETPSILSKEISVHHAPTMSQNLETAAEQRKREETSQQESNKFDVGEKDEVPFSQLKKTSLQKMLFPDTQDEGPKMVGTADKNLEPIKLESTDIYTKRPLRKRLNESLKSNEIVTLSSSDENFNLKNNWRRKKGQKAIIVNRKRLRRNENAPNTSETGDVNSTSNPNSRMEEKSTESEECVLKGNLSPHETSKLRMKRRSLRLKEVCKNTLNLCEKNDEKQTSDQDSGGEEEKATKLSQSEEFASKANLLPLKHLNLGKRRKSQRLEQINTATASSDRNSEEKSCLERGKIETSLPLAEETQSEELQSASASTDSGGGKAVCVAHELANLTKRRKVSKKSGDIGPSAIGPSHFKPLINDAQGDDRIIKKINKHFARGTELSHTQPEVAAQSFRLAARFAQVRIDKEKVESELMEMEHSVLMNHNKHLQEKRDLLLKNLLNIHNDTCSRFKQSLECNTGCVVKDPILRTFFSESQCNLEIISDRKSRRKESILQDALKLYASDDALKPPSRTSSRGRGNSRKPGV